MEHLLRMTYRAINQENPIKLKMRSSGTYRYDNIISAADGEFIILDELILLLDRNDIDVTMTLSHGKSYIDERSGTAYNLYTYGLTDHAIYDQFYCFRYDTVNNIYGIRYKSFSTLYKPVKQINLVFRGPPDIDFSMAYSISYFIGKESDIYGGQAGCHKKD